MFFLRNHLVTRYDGLEIHELLCILFIWNFNKMPVYSNPQSYPMIGKPGTVPEVTRPQPSPNIPGVIIGVSPPQQPIRTRDPHLYM